MNWAEIKTNDIANGEGVRTSLFVSGCRHHCKNCFNEITWDFSYGHLFTEETMEDIFKSVDHSWINGISLRTKPCGATPDLRLSKSSAVRKKKAVPQPTSARKCCRSLTYLLTARMWKICTQSHSNSVVHPTKE